MHCCFIDIALDVMDALMKKRLIQHRIKLSSFFWLVTPQIKSNCENSVSSICFTQQEIMRQRVQLWHILCHCILLETSEVN